MDVRLVPTTLGPVEVAADPIDRPVAVVLPGGHCPATVDVGWDILRGAGLAIVSLSRPGYGRTRVGHRSAVEFVPAMDEVLAALGVGEVAATVGVSFAGMQAAEFARLTRLPMARLVLASAAPSTRSYPDTWYEGLMAPVVFGPGVQRATWVATSAMVGVDAGLRALVASLSKLPSPRWWPQWTADDKAAARRTFRAMDSGTGFVQDVRQSQPGTAAARAAHLREVPCPTLVMGSSYDAGVSFRHAEDQARLIPGARLVDTLAESHLFWLGPRKADTAATLREFLAE